MGMKQYQDKFKREQVDGEILAECDETVLTNDLGVTSRLHRMRLLKIISGTYIWLLATSTGFKSEVSITVVHVTVVHVCIFNNLCFVVVMLLYLIALHDLFTAF